jgi:hypothetical protein
VERGRERWATKTEWVTEHPGAATCPASGGLEAPLLLPMLPWVRDLYGGGAMLCRNVAGFRTGSRPMRFRYAPEGPTCSRKGSGANARNALLPERGEDEDIGDRHLESMVIEQRPPRPDERSHGARQNHNLRLGRCLHRPVPRGPYGGRDLPASELRMRSVWCTAHTAAG